MKPWITRINANWIGKSQSRRGGLQCVEVFASGTLERSGETEAPMQLVSRCLSRFAS